MKSISPAPDQRPARRPRALRAAAVTGLVLMTLATTGAVPVSQGSGSSAVAGSGHVVLVELFTSQGCSSCPPADRLLSKIAEESAGRVVTLSFHVDFWNSAGWTDPFSKKDWTARQIDYRRVLGLSQVYTPQAVVDGRQEMVGSNAEALRAAIDAAQARPGAGIALTVAPSGSGSKWDVGVEVTLPEELRGRRLNLLLATYETGLTTPVGRGENGGRTLRNDYVVRALERIDRLAPNSPPETRHATSVRVSKDWDASRIGVAAFVQDPASLEIRGAAARPLRTD